MQVWPLLSHLPVARRAAACSMGKSAATIAGDLPPSSSVSGVRLGAAAAITLRHTAVEPVNTRGSNGRAENAATDRKSVGKGKSEGVRVALGGSRKIKTKKQ